MLMTFEEVMDQLKEWGSEQTVRIYKNHGAKDPIYGVSVANLKKIVKKVKVDQNLALELYNSMNSDAMYLAALIADPKQFTEEMLEDWAEKATWYMISEYSVPWVAAESDHGLKMARKWIESDDEKIATSGWTTYSGLTSLLPDDQLDLDEIEKLMLRIKETIHSAPNRVRYTMNGFILSVGINITSYTNAAIAVSNEIGKVSVDMGGTACKVPYGPDYIQNAIDKGRTGKKKKKLRC